MNLGDDGPIGDLQALRANASTFSDAVSGTTVAGGHAAYGVAVGMQYTGLVADIGDKAVGDNDTLNAGVDVVNDLFDTNIDHKWSWGDYNDFKGDTWKVPATSAW